nr:MAG TPA: TFIIB Transcription factor zinc-finger [Caudoviricetes sp.]
MIKGCPHCGLTVEERKLYTVPIEGVETIRDECSGVEYDLSALQVLCYWEQ